MKRELSKEQANAMLAVAIVAHGLLPQCFSENAKRFNATNNIVDRTIELIGRIVGDTTMAMVDKLCPGYSEEEEENTEFIRWLVKEYQDLINECAEAAAAQLKLDDTEAEAEA